VSAQPSPPPAPPTWPESSGRPVLFLLDAASALEERLLRRWIEEGRPAGESDDDVVAIPASRRRRATRGRRRLESLLASGADPLLAPLRVVWLARERDGRRQVRLGDALRLGDPRDPNRLREHWVLRTQPDRCRIVAGEPAPASELRARWQEACGGDSGETVGFAEFVTRQAQLALERAERRVRGARYKVPRFVHEDILSRPAFRGGLARIARGEGRDEQRVRRDGERYLREIAASHSPFVIDIVMQLWRSMGRGYGEPQYDPAEIDGVRALSQRHPVVFLPTHKSNLDHPTLQYILHEEGLPPNHTAAGINMNFFPVGPLVRRSGAFFIRRTFKDNEVYKFVLQNYIDYLVEKRFPLEWYIEGGRSRSGKLLPPRFGLLAYVADAYRRARSEDVVLIPASIAYDQITDVGDYASEARGGAKEREGFGWFLRVLRRAGRNYGHIHIRFGEPVFLSKTLGAPDPAAEPDPDEQNLALQKLAFEVCVRINRATPITPTSLVALALLGRGDRALSLPEMVEALRNLVGYVRLRHLPTTEALDLDRPESVEGALDALTRNGVLTCYAAGVEPVWKIEPDQELAAAYYRNTVIHFFVNGAIAELALLRAAEDDVFDRRQEFWDEVLRLRDLLKFEFFFADKDLFLGEIRHELGLHDPEWESRLDAGASAIQALFPLIRPYHSHRILRPFLEAYRVVADVLAAYQPGSELDDAVLLKESLALGRQYALQRHIHSSESVSKVLFGNALKLARNRELLRADGAELRARRAAFAGELSEAIRRVNAVASLVAARHAGVLGSTSVLGIRLAGRRAPASAGD
jgi:glycerol-3-phosphate O-acyltransferase